MTRGRGDAETRRAETRDAETRLRGDTNGGHGTREGDTEMKEINSLSYRVPRPRVSAPLRILSSRVSASARPVPI